jgi:predicted amidohydrolase YtcJ
MKVNCAFTLALLYCALPGPPAAAQMKVYADTVYLHGTVVTMNPQSPAAEAVAVKSGRILAVGRDREVSAMASPQTTVVDLAGKTMLPGFYAAHDHFVEAGTVALYSVDLNSPPIGKIETIADVIAALREKARTAKPGAWILGRGYDDTLLREKRHPTRADLDQASTDHPIWITHISGHLGAGNSKALALANITRATPQPRNGRIRKDPATGEPNGVLEECGSMVSRHIPAHSPQEMLEAIRWAGKHYLSKGVTTTCIAGGTASSIRSLQRARQAGVLPIRVITMCSKSSPNQRSAAESGGMLTGFGDDWLRLGAIKIWSDGSLQGYTGYLKLPYFKAPAEDAAYRGYPSRSREDLVRMVVQLNRDGYQIAIHANGDAAIDDVLAAYRSASAQNPRPDARHRIEHCQTVREDQLDEIERLGITRSFFIGHVFYWGDRHRDIFLGPERAARISPLASAARRGIKFTLHDDTPVTPVNPLLLVWGAVNRVTRNSEVLGPEQRIGAAQALRAVTIDAAYQNFEEDRKGSIEPGKLADFVVLDENPLTAPPLHIKDIRIAMTIVGDKAYRE